MNLNKSTNCKNKMTKYIPPIRSTKELTASIAKKVSNQRKAKIIVHNNETVDLDIIEDTESSLSTPTTIDYLGVVDHSTVQY